MWSFVSSTSLSREARLTCFVPLPCFYIRLLFRSDESSPVFDDPMFSRSKHWRMSTSHLTHEMFDGWGWGEVVPDGESFSRPEDDGGGSISKETSDKSCRSQSHRLHLCQYNVA